MHLDWMVELGAINLAAMARETARRFGAELPLPAAGTRLWIWSDLHFDDERIWWSAKRPFRSLREMNQGLRDRWRQAVAPGDTVVFAPVTRRLDHDGNAHGCATRDSSSS